MIRCPQTGRSYVRRARQVHTAKKDPANAVGNAPKHACLFSLLGFVLVSWFRYRMIRLHLEGRNVSKILEQVSLPLCNAPGRERTVQIQSSLACVTKLTGTEAKRVVVGLHGYGDNARNFAELADEFRLPDTLWVFPLAPGAVPMTAGGGQWYDLYGPARRDVASSSDAVSKLLTSIREITGLPSEKTVLLGFSQGSYIALYTALRLPVKLAGVVALSGYLGQVHRTPLPLPWHVRETPFFVAHGMHDNVILPAQHFETLDALDTWDCEKVTGKTYAMAHSLHPTEIGDIRNFIFEHT
jgi:phospholipase/carboxylesterase